MIRAAVKVVDAENAENAGDVVYAEDAETATVEEPTAAMRWLAAAAGSGVAGTGRYEQGAAAAVDDDDAAAAAGTAVPGAVDVGTEQS